MVMAVIAHRLLEEDRPALLAHFRMLSRNDRRLRFSSSMSDRALVRYVEGMDLVNGAAFGVYCPDAALCAVTHVALADGAAEVGTSVLDRQRGRGYGTALLTRAAIWARNRGINRMYMHYLADNAVVMYIARKAGMHVATSRGEADAHLVLKPATVVSFAAEWLQDAIATIYDVTCRLRRACVSAHGSQ